VNGQNVFLWGARSARAVSANVGGSQECDKE
jgi:hypothetical protein